MSDILVVSVGTTPPVVTETLWHLFQRDPPFVPEQVHILTTRTGEEALRRGKTDGFLCDPDERGRIDHPDRGGRLAQLYRAYRHPLPTVHIHVSPEEPEDLRDEGSTLDYADLCVRVLATLRQKHSKARLHVSLAGGRKTMSFHMGSALSLLGEPEDELSHVLVRPADYEGPDFWWPGMPETVERGGRELRTAQARVDLVPVPFVPMKAYVDPALLRGLIDGQVSYRTLVETVAGRLVPELRLERRSRRVAFGAAEISLEPVRFALLYVLATAWRDQWCGYGPEGKGGCGWLTWEDFVPGGRGAKLLCEIHREIAESPASCGNILSDYLAGKRLNDEQILRVIESLQQMRSKMKAALRRLPPVGRYRIDIGSRRISVQEPDQGGRQLYVFGLAGVEPGRVTIG